MPKPSKNLHRTVTPERLDAWCRALGDHWLDFLSAYDPIVRSVDSLIDHAVHVDPKKISAALAAIQVTLSRSIRIMRGDPPAPKEPATLRFGYRGRLRSKLELVDAVVIASDSVAIKASSRVLARKMRREHPTVVKVIPSLPAVIAINADAYAWAQLAESGALRPSMLHEALRGDTCALAAPLTRKGSWSLPVHVQRLAAVTAGTGIVIAIFRTGIFGPAFQACGDAAAARFQVVDMIVRSSGQT